MGISVRAPFIALIGLAGLAVLGVHPLLHFQFPPPWPDETSFISPAYAFAQNGSFFDPGMNPDRDVMWMPPGYMLILAGLFRIFGYSFGLARFASSLATAAALVVIARIAWTTARDRFSSGAVVAAAFLSPYVLINANIARMDAFVVLGGVLALAACLARRPNLAAAIVLCSGLIHFNAVYFVPPVLAALWWHKARPAWIDCAALAVACVLWGAYATYALNNWPGFLQDMGVQFAAKRVTEWRWPPWFLVVAIVVAGLLAFRRRGQPAFVAVFGCCFLVLAYVGRELWYDAAQPVGAALVALGALSGFRFRAITRMALPVLVVLVAWPRPDIRPFLPDAAMLKRDYLAPAELAKVRRFIATLPPGATVAFWGRGLEPFFLADLAHAGAHWTTLTHSATQLFPWRQSDWLVSCDSADLTPIMLFYDGPGGRQGRDSGCKITKS